MTDTDIVARLRNGRWVGGEVVALEAADEIDRLRAALLVCEKALGAPLTNHRTVEAFRVINDLLKTAKNQTL